MLILTQCAIHIKHTTTDFPVYIITVPFVCIQRIAQSFGKLRQTCIMVFTFKLTFKSPIFPTGLFLRCFQLSRRPAFFLRLFFHFEVYRIWCRTLTKIRKQTYLQQFRSFHLLHKLFICLLLRSDFITSWSATPHRNKIHTIGHSREISSSISSSRRPIGIPSESYGTIVIPSSRLIGAQIGIICLTLRIVHCGIPAYMVYLNILHIHARSYHHACQWNNI